MCFDQLVYKLSEQIYAHYKTQAASILLDKPFKTQLETIVNKVIRLHVPKSRYANVLRQRNVQLLGRSVDINLLIGHRLNNSLRQNLEHAISRFEASDLSTIGELESLVNNVRLTHRLLSEHFDIDNWDAIWSEINENASLLSFHGRVIVHVRKKKKNSNATFKN